MPKTKTTKVCRLCGIDKPLSAFHRHKSYADGHRSQCIECLREPSRLASNAAYNSDKKREYHLRSLYGLEIEEYHALVDKQAGRCAICDKVGKLFVDHCHDTKLVRGLLCTKCNVGLGMFGDDVEALESALEYLKETGHA